MRLDDEICCCYHVSLRKLINHARINRPKRASQMTDCFNAGTGCGWCIPILKMVFERVRDGGEIDIAISPEEHLHRRAEYRASGQPRNSF